jgi:hypothetical protein
MGQKSVQVLDASKRDEDGLLVKAPADEAAMRDSSSCSTLTVVPGPTMSVCGSDVIPDTRTWRARNTDSARAETPAAPRSVRSRRPPNAAIPPTFWACFEGVPNATAVTSCSVVIEYTAGRGSDCGIHTFGSTLLPNPARLHERSLIGERVAAERSSRNFLPTNLFGSCPGATAPSACYEPRGPIDTRRASRMTSEDGSFGF